jgi:hypothetical protein
MTAPFDINEVIPSKAKTYVGLIGSIVTFVAPLALSVSDALPPPWPAVIGGVLAVLTALGIYKAPYKPTDETVLVHKSEVAAPEQPPATPDNPVPPSGWQVGGGGNGGTYTNPWL